MELLSPDASRRYADLVRLLPRVAVGLDFDGTLAPIVEDPARARIHPDAPGLLVDLAGHVRSLALVTGRPVAQVLELGDLERVGRELADRGRVFEVHGQYGNEHWTSAEGMVRAASAPPGLDRFLAALPDLLDRVGAAQAHVETKPLGVAVHTRRMPDPAGAYARVRDPLAALAAEHGLEVVPGRQVVELRVPGPDKGDVVRRHATAAGADGYLFAGDDVGDLAAAAAVADLRARGLVTLVVCAASAEEDRLRAVADVAVQGVEGMLAFLRMLLRDARAGQAS